MNDETKAANEALVESMLRQLRGCVSVGDEMTLDHACLIDDAADWIAGEPARIAAAREEQREACARFLGATMEQADDLERDDVDMVDTVCATPLDARPLADRIAELEAQKVDLKTLIQDLRERAEKAERLADQLCAVLGREVGNRGDSEGAVDVAERIIRERDEAVAALRGLLRDEWYTYEGNLEASGRASVDDLNAARAVLAKYPEGKR